MNRHLLDNLLNVPQIRESINKQMKKIIITELKENDRGERKNDSRRDERKKEMEGREEGI